MKRTILITGGAGYIGSHTAVELIKYGYDAVIVDNLSNAKITSIAHIEKITGVKPYFYQADVRDEAKLSDIFSQHSIVAVIHFAGLKAVGESTNKPVEYYSNNVSGLISIISVMVKFGCFNLVFSSSATVYGKQKINPIKEGARLLATNPYGRSKLIIEQMLTDLPVANSNWRISVLRYFNPIGAHPSGLLGENPNNIPNNLMPYISRVAVGALPKLYVFGNDYNTKDGTGMRDYIHILDIASGHINALEFLFNNNKNIITLNLGTGKAYSVLDVIAMFSDISGKKINYEIAPRRFGDIDICYADVTLVKKVLNWQAKYSIKQACIDLWNWQKLQ